MSSGHTTPDNGELLAALTARDARAVGPALLEAVLTVPAVRNDDGRLRPSGEQQADGSWHVVAFTDVARLHAWRPEIEHFARVPGSDLVDLALEIDATLLRLDPGADHGGHLDRPALEQVRSLPREAGPEPLAAPGAWATDELRRAVGDVTAGDDAVERAWLADRGDRPTVVLRLREDGEAERTIDAIVEVLRRHLPAGTAIDFLTADDEQAAQAEATGPAL